MVESLERRCLYSATVGQLGTVLQQGSGGWSWDVPELVASMPTITSHGTLVISGTSSDDVIAVTRKGHHLGVSVLNDVWPFALGYSTTQVKRLVIETGDGNDHVFVAGDIHLRCTLSGGAGNDILYGSTGDTLVGGSGNDKLFLHRPPDAMPTGDEVVAFDPAPEGPALLMGGTGNDTLIASGGDSVIGGKGNDLALWSDYTNTIYEYAPDWTPAQYPSQAKSVWGDRASGIERFDQTGHYFSSGGLDLSGPVHLDAG